MPLTITTQLILEAAARRDWPATVINEKSNLYQLMTPKGMFYVRNARTYKGPGVNEYIANNKLVFYDLAANIAGVEQPATQVVSDNSASLEFLNTYKRIVVKPFNQSHGNGITIDVTNEQELQVALDTAGTFSKRILLQQQIAGDDYRVLVIDGKIVAAAVREPAHVIGDGTHTVAELIAIENQRPERGEGYTKPKSYIDVVSAEQFLGNRLNQVPAAGEKFIVVGVANIGRGGTAIDVTDSLSDTLVLQTLAVVEYFKLEFVGVDFIVDQDGRAHLIEANTYPSFGLHAYPTVGQPRLVADNFLDWLIK